MASRPSKYAHVLGDLPKFQKLDPERQDLIDAVKAEILSSTLGERDYNVTAQILRGLADAEEVIKHVIDLAKRAVGEKQNAASVARAWADVRAIDDAIDGWRANVQMLLDAYEQLMLKKMEDEGIKSLSLESGATVSTFGEPYGRVVDKEAFRLWCVAPADRCMTCHFGEHDLTAGHPYHPGGGLERQLQLWPSTMSSLVKERTLQGEAPPDGVEVMAKDIVRLSR